MDKTDLRSFQGLPTDFRSIPDSLGPKGTPTRWNYFPVSLPNSTSGVAKYIAHFPQALRMLDRVSGPPILRELSGCYSTETPPADLETGGCISAIYQVSLNNIALLANRNCSQRGRVFLLDV